MDDGKGEDAPEPVTPLWQATTPSRTWLRNLHTIVVLEGGPSACPGWIGLRAVVEAWYAGGRGVGGCPSPTCCFASSIPSGRLPINFPASTEANAWLNFPGLDCPPQSRSDAPHPQRRPRWGYSLGGATQSKTRPLFSLSRLWGFPNPFWL